MSNLLEQQRINAYARAREVGIPGVLTRALKAGMSLTEARGVVEECKDRRNPHQFCNAMISAWRSEG